MIKLQENVPQYYVEQSRDFQLFLRVLDCIQNGVKFDIDSMIYLLDPTKVNNRMLSLFCERVGFYPKRELNSNMLRYIISAFPYLMKYKGSKKGIEEAIAVVLKADNVYANWKISVYNSTHTIEIIIDKDYDYQALSELLEYIIPIGYTTRLALGNSLSKTTELTEVSLVDVILDPAVTISQVVSNNSNFRWPEYTIERTQVDIYENATKSIVFDEAESVYIITYEYCDSVASQIFKNKIVLKIYKDDPNRYIGTIGRSEIIGSLNDLSLHDNNIVDGIDNPELESIGDNIIRNNWTLTDQGELSATGAKQVFRTNAELLETETTLNKGQIQIPHGTKLTVGALVLDNIGSLGEIVEITNDSVRIETKVYNKIEGAA